MFRLFWLIALQLLFFRTTLNKKTVDARPLTENGWILWQKGKRDSYTVTLGLFLCNKCRAHQHSQVNQFSKNVYIKINLFVLDSVSITLYLNLLNALSVVYHRVHWIV